MKSIPACHPDKKYGARGLCVNCYNKWLRVTNPAYHERSKESSRLARSKPNGIRARDNSLLKQRYGITIEEKEQMLLEQKGLCKVCKRIKKLVVEHNHTTKKVRGLTCHGCNTLIGVLENNRNILPEALTYLTVGGFK
jgi:hypothetical protein